MCQVCTVKTDIKVEARCKKMEARCIVKIGSKVEARCIVKIGIKVKARCLECVKSAL